MILNEKQNTLALNQRAQGSNPWQADKKGIQMTSKARKRQCLWAFFIF
jgi:hypothetical protein